MDGLPRTAARSKYDRDGGAGAVSLLIRLSHKARRCNVHGECRLCCMMTVSLVICNPIVRAVYNFSKIHPVQNGLP